MTRLKTANLAFNKKNGTWDLKDNKSQEVLASFNTKESATKGGVLEKSLGKEGGSVRIHKKDGKIQEERTFPGEKDPRNSRG